jgi:cbb3-type cytochrome oxidase subunit 3
MEYRTSIPRTLGLAALGILLIAAAYFSARTGLGLIQAVGWFGVAFFSLCFVAILFQLFRRGPTVVIDELGVFDRRMGVGRISWQDIASVSVSKVRRQRFISLWLRNEEQYLSQCSAASRRALAAANRALGFSPFCMSFTGLTPGLDDAYARLKARVPERAGV